MYVRVYASAFTYLYVYVMTVKYLSMNPCTSCRLQIDIYLQYRIGYCRLLLFIRFKLIAINCIRYQFFIN